MPFSQQLDLYQRERFHVSRSSNLEYPDKLSVLSRQLESNSRQSLPGLAKTVTEVSRERNPVRWEYAERAAVKMFTWDNKPTHFCWCLQRLKAKWAKHKQSARFACTSKHCDQHGRLPFRPDQFKQIQTVFGSRIRCYWWVLWLKDIRLTCEAGRTANETFWNGGKVRSQKANKCHLASYKIGQVLLVQSRESRRRWWGKVFEVDDAASLLPAFRDKQKVPA